MKKLLAILLTSLLMFTGCTQSNDDKPSSNTACKPGTYTGESTGYGDGKITATVTVDEDSIVEVKLEGENETDGIGIPVLETFGDKIVKAQSVDIDAVAGASTTSEGVLKAVSAALEGNCDLTKLVGAESNKDETETLSADVVILGAGGAGMTAAIEASDAGKSVIIVEIAGITGGNSTRATGGMNAGKTTVQDTNEFKEQAGVEKRLETAATTYPELSELTKTVKAQYDEYLANPTGYFDSKELFILDTLVGGTNVNNPTLVETLVGNSPAGIEWLKTKGADLNLVGSFGGASVKRIHKPTKDGKSIAVGSYIIPILQDNAEKGGVEFLMETEATDILVEGGKVVGVKATNADGEMTIDAKSVIVATGGFGANSELVVSYRPDLAGFVTTNTPTAQGDGIKMVEAVGGALVDVDQIQIHPTVEQNTSALITEGLRGDGAILVNKEGKRFFDEVGTRDAVSAAIIAQTDSTSYLIIDQKMVDKSAVIAGYIKKGFTVEGETIADLAKAMGVDEANLVATLDTWNASVDAKKDDEFGRTSFAEKLDTGKFYAIQVAPGVHHTMGGVKINEKTEVLDTTGKAISGLYAAGEVTGGVHGSNRLGGNAVADFVVFGRIAGQNAAAYAK